MARLPARGALVCLLRPAWAYTTAAAETAAASGHINLVSMIGSLATREVASSSDSVGGATQAAEASEGPMDLSYRVAHRTVRWATHAFDRIDHQIGSFWIAVGMIALCLCTFVMCW